MMDLLKPALLAMALTACVTQSADAARTSVRSVTASTVIAASPKAVWDIINNPNTFNDRVKSIHGNEAIIEHVYQEIPLIPGSRVIYKIKVVPGSRIDFQMIESDRFKAFSGYWWIKDSTSSTTTLELSTLIDPGLPLPRRLIEAYTHKKSKERLKKVKRLAEMNKRS